MEALRASFEKTGVVPPALENRPVLTEDVAFYVESFYILSAFRSAGFSGPNPLAFSDVIRYGELVGYTAPADLLFFTTVLLACDVAYRDAVDEKVKAKSPQTK